VATGNGGWGDGGQSRAFRLKLQLVQEEEEEEEEEEEKEEEAEEDTEEEEEQEEEAEEEQEEEEQERGGGDGGADGEAEGGGTVFSLGLFFSQQRWVDVLHIAEKQLQLAQLQFFGTIECLYSFSGGVRCSCL